MKKLSLILSLIFNDHILVTLRKPRANHENHNKEKLQIAKQRHHHLNILI
jgi:hypothetical protein